MSGHRNQQKSEEPEGRRHLSEENDRAVDELEFEQRLPGKRLEDSDGSRSKRDGCGRELDEREIAGCTVPELHPTRIILPRQSPTAGTRLSREPATQNRNFVGHPQHASSWLLPAFCFSEA